MFLGIPLTHLIKQTNKHWRRYQIQCSRSLLSILNFDRTLDKMVCSMVQTCIWNHPSQQIVLCRSFKGMIKWSNHNLETPWTSKPSPKFKYFVGITKHQAHQSLNVNAKQLWVINNNLQCFFICCFCDDFWLSTVFPSFKHLFVFFS